MGYSLRDIAEELGAQLHGDEDCRIDCVATLAGAGPGGISFLANRLYRSQLLTTRASAVILEAEFLSSCPVAALVVSNPYLGYARVAALLSPEQPLPAGVHASAYVSDGATVDASACIGPQAVVEDRARVGARSHIGPGCVIGAGATVGDDCTLKANVTICHDVRIGDRALLHPGVVIGADGFGIANDGGVWVKVPQLGAVVIADDVEIGANTTIDRGAGPDTVIGAGCRIDNLVQIGHNVQLGKGCVIVAQVGISGSTRIGDNVMIGGQGGISGHVDIGKGAQIAAKSGVRSNIPAGTQYGGIPAVPIRDWHRQVVTLAGLSKRKGK